MASSREVKNRVGHGSVRRAIAKLAITRLKENARRATAGNQPETNPPPTSGTAKTSPAPYFLFGIGSLEFLAGARRAICSRRVFSPHTLDVRCFSIIVTATASALIDVSDL